MANNVVLRENLGADAVFDEDAESIYFLAATQGTGAPSAPPLVPEKVWFYVNTTPTPDELWVWNPVTEAWSKPAGAAGAPTDGWALSGNAADPGDQLGTTNAQALEIIADGDVVIEADPAEGVTIQPGGVGAVTADTHQLHVGPLNPYLPGAASSLSSGDATLAVASHRFVLLSTEGEEGESSVSFGVARALGGGARVNVDSTLGQGSPSGFGVFQSRATARTTGGTLVSSSTTSGDAFGDLEFVGSQPAGHQARLRIEAGLDSDQPEVGIRVAHPDSPYGAQELTLNPGGLRLDDAVSEVDLTPVGGAGDVTSVLVAKQQSSGPGSEAGMYLQSGVLKLAVDGSDLELQLVSADDDEAIIDVLATIPTADVGSGSYDPGVDAERAPNGGSLPPGPLSDFVEAILTWESGHKSSITITDDYVIDSRQYDEGGALDQYISADTSAAAITINSDSLAGTISNPSSPYDGDYRWRGKREVVCENVGSNSLFVGGWIVAPSEAIVLRVTGLGLRAFKLEPATLD